MLTDRPERFSQVPAVRSTRQLAVSVAGYAALEEALVYQSDVAHRERAAAELVLPPDPIVR